MSFFSSVVYAQGVDIKEVVKPPFENFGELFTSIISFALAAAGVVFFFMFLWGGLRYMMSRGDDKALDSARGTLTTAIVGLLIIVSAVILFNIILSVARPS